MIFDDMSYCCNEKCDRNCKRNYKNILKENSNIWFSNFNVEDPNNCEFFIEKGE